MSKFKKIANIDYKKELKAFIHDRGVRALFFLSIVLTFLYYVLALDKGKCIENYRGMILLMWICDLVFIILYKVYKFNYQLVIMFIFIFHTGILVRNIFNTEIETGNITTKAALLNEQGIIIVGIICLIIGAVSVKYLDRIVFNKTINIIALGGTALLYIILLLFGTKKHDTIAWIGPIQLTEVIKIIAIVYFSYLFATKKIGEIKKIVFATAFMMINIGGSVLIHELGSLLVMLLVFLVYLLLFVKSTKDLIRSYAIFAGIGALGVAFITIFYRFGINKTITRINIWLHPDLDPTGIGFQALKAKEAIMLGGLFGSNRKIAVPVIDSDYVFVGIAMKLGLIFCFLLLIMFLLLLINGAVEYVNARSKFHIGLIAGSVYYIFFQALVVFGGSTGLIPMTGITVPLISQGGASIAVTMIMIGFIIGTHYNNYDLEINDIVIDEMELEENIPKEKVYIVGKDLGGNSGQDVFCRSEVGNRTENQDDYYVNKRNGIYAIFDGMGGGIKGGEASDRLKNTIEEEIPKLLESEEDIDSFIDEVNNVVKNISNDFYEEYNKNAFSYGTTIAMIVKFKDEFILFNAGDSRIYSFGRNDSIKLETKDHNVAWIARRDGMSEEEIKKRKLASRLLRYVGEKDINMDVHKISISEVSGFLLATDGLYASLSEDEMQESFQEETTARNTLNRLIDESLSRDGSDNTTGICLMYINEDGEPKFGDTQILK